MMSVNDSVAFCRASQRHFRVYYVNDVMVGEKRSTDKILQVYVKPKTNCFNRVLEYSFFVKCLWTDASDTLSVFESFLDNVCSDVIDIRFFN